MLEGSSRGTGYRSFTDWAKETFEPAPEIKEETQITQPIQESIETEPQEEPVVKETSSRRDVVSTLLEKLSDFDWDDEVAEIPQPIKKKESKSVPDLEKIVSRIEEKIQSIKKDDRIEKIYEEEKREVTPEPVKKEQIREKIEPVNERIEEEREIIQEETGKDYRIFRDRDENFECQLSVEGTSLNDAKVRIVIESDAWNFVFYGKVYGDGKCVVPIKKGLPLMEGATGNIKLEVIAEDQLFVGWEDRFKVAASKKVKVELKEQKSVRVSFNNNSLNENRKA